MTTLSRSLRFINSNWFVYLADWFVGLVQSLFSYLIWSCQLLLYQCASHVFFLLCVLSICFAVLSLDSFVIGAWLN